MLIRSTSKGPDFFIVNRHEAIGVWEGKDDRQDKNNCRQPVSPILRMFVKHAVECGDQTNREAKKCRALNQREAEDGRPSDEVYAMHCRLCGRRRLCGDAGRTVTIYP